MKLYDELVWRGLIENITDQSLIEKINNGGLTFYIGTDPTGDSLHIGHYSTFSMATRLKKGGHNPILLVGGATGLIGDPKPTAERPMITKELLEQLYSDLDFENYTDKEKCKMLKQFYNNLNIRRISK